MISLNDLNKEQRDAVVSTEGPLLILAGAGSGKTRVLTYRTAYLIEEKGIDPYHILAITFTNKAAGEMRDRIANLAGAAGQAVWTSTFHSLCVRILRRYIDRLGYSSHFTICDADGQKALMKDICKQLQIDTKLHKERTLLNAISHAKDELIDPVAFEESAADYNTRIQAKVYNEYQRRLRENNALDFDDLIMKTVELFKLDAQVLDSYQERFRYIMVDEYQDTNTAQFELVRLLARKYRNLCVVGDDDQSIYKFRGANIYNILNFEKHFEDAKVIRLEQNYRSTQNILDAANAVIANNASRKDKRLWTAAGSGDRITFKQVETGWEEADFVCRDIRCRVADGEFSYGDCAVLYRTNAQSRLFEERFLTANVPYKIVGGVNFYSRKEVKDLLAYLKTIDNGQDDMAVYRIINVPKRGIGAASIGKVNSYAQEHGMDFFQAVCMADKIPGMGRTGLKILDFARFIQDLRAKARVLPVPELLKAVIDETGYERELMAEGTDEALSRIENMDELVSKAASYMEEADEPSLGGFLEEVALVADIDDLEEGSDYVPLMTLHSAKGLEFANVYLVGMEDGLFPAYHVMTSDERTNAGTNAELEEERRLAYVGITRAKRHLTITSAETRTLRGETHRNAVSQFLKEIPEEILSEPVQQAQQQSHQREQWRDPDYVSPFQKAKSEFLRTPAYGMDLGGATVRASGSRGSVYGTSGTGGSLQDSGVFDNKEQDGFTKKQKVPTYTAPSNQRNFSTGNGSLGALDYGVGDRVRHIKFGDGVVTAIVEGGRDYEVTVDFDKAGTKKMFAGFAKLKPI